MNFKYSFYQIIFFLLVLLPSNAFSNDRINEIEPSYFSQCSHHLIHFLTDQNQDPSDLSKEIKALKKIYLCSSHSSYFNESVKNESCNSPIESTWNISSIFKNKDNKFVLKNFNKKYCKQPGLFLNWKDHLCDYSYKTLSGSEITYTLLQHIKTPPKAWENCVNKVVREKGEIAFLVKQTDKTIKFNFNHTLPKKADSTENLNQDNYPSSNWEFEISNPEKPAYLIAEHPNNKIKFKYQIPARICIKPVYKKQRMSVCGIKYKEKKDDSRDKCSFYRTIKIASPSCPLLNTKENCTNNRIARSPVGGCSVCGSQCLASGLSRGQCSESGRSFIGKSCRMQCMKCVTQNTYAKCLDKKVFVPCNKKTQYREIYNECRLPQLYQQYIRCDAWLTVPQPESIQKETTTLREK